MLYEKYDHQIREAEELGETLGRVFDLYEAREKAAAFAITFAGMCLEAFLYDYGATELDDSYVRHVDKLDMTSKAFVIPRLVCGKGIDKSGPVYARVRNLQKARNDLVHFKSKRFAESRRSSRLLDVSFQEDQGSSQLTLASTSLTNYALFGK